MRLEVRQFAVMGPDSVRAAETAVCAAHQGRYWEYRDALFTAYRSTGREAYSPDHLAQVAEAVGLEPKAFGDCLAGGQGGREVVEDVAQGERDGVEAIPAVFVDGRKVVGTQPFETFARLIDDSLGR